MIANIETVFFLVWCFKYDNEFFPNMYSDRTR